jgi:UDP-N-acetylmuramyl tripeptide synthase
VSGLSRALRIGGGTAAPGEIAIRLDPRALEKLAARLGCGLVVVSGTNGKTTTARILAEILAAAGRRVVHNRAGANLVGGIVSTLAADAPRQPSGGSAIAVLETDEAALPELVTRTCPAVVVLTNLFRDQLDRYGEVDSITKRWRAAVGALPDSTTLVANADDPTLAALVDAVACRTVLYGIAESRYKLPGLPHGAETLPCPGCGGPLTYRGLYVGHLGDWRCPACGRARAELDVAGFGIELRSVDHQSLKVSGPGPVSHFDVRLPGLYNTYNVLAALAAASAFNLPPEVCRLAVSRYRGAFGRAERITYGDHSVMIMLVKNAVGFDEVLRTIIDVDETRHCPLLLCLNDAASDGRDVSWIWDVDLERLAALPNLVFCAGSRAADMRNRLHYAGVAPDRIRRLGADLSDALDDFTTALPANACGFILPTYSAMLELRSLLARRLHLTAFWDD